MITLYGKPEEIKEVFDFIDSSRFVYVNQKGELPEDEFFCSMFPGSLYRLAGENKFHLETKHKPADVSELSSFFSKVGFLSLSLTEGSGEEILYMINGKILYVVYIDIEGPVLWQEVTGSKMESVNDLVEHYFDNHPSNDRY